jgi:hypothetical protein
MKRKSTINNVRHNILSGLNTPMVPPIRLRLKKNLTLKQRVVLVDCAEKNEDLTLAELATFAKNEFKMTTRPSKSRIWKVLDERDSSPKLSELKKGQEERRSFVGPDIPELDKYLYNAVLEHQNNNVGISGPALKFLAQSYCKYNLHISESQMPSLSNGWFEGFKRRWGLHGYQIHGEVGSVVFPRFD